MVSFTAAASALVLFSSAVTASSSTRGNTVNRRLSFETIANYGPASQVTDHVSQP
jgi:hypothetical protein